MIDSSPGKCKRHAVYLGLGSNLGDRDDYLRRALEALQTVLTLDRISSVYDTAPMLVENQRRFHNLACAGRTALDPFALLRATQGIETQLGRNTGLRYGPRVIDIDLLFYDSLVMTSPQLTLPHPGLAERGFVLLPLYEIAPRKRHPVLRTRVAELAAALPSVDVRPLGPLSRANG
jgi:2-amino-4-hydroxy-6-hydroxymethyldihydropteridine diphosphokinase